MNPSILNTIERIKNSFNDFSEKKTNEIQISFHLKLGKFFLKVRFEPSYPVDPPKLLASVIASHPLIDIFGIITYPEYDTWTEETDICNILYRIQSDFSINPPTPLKEKIFPDFKEALSIYNKPLISESDLIEVVKLTDEYKKIEDEKNKKLEENLELAKEVLRIKEEYSNKVHEKSKEIEEYHKIKDEIVLLERECEKAQEKFNKFIVPQKIKELEYECQRGANRIFSQFIQKEIGVDEFIENYVNEVKGAKKIGLIRNKY